MWRLPLTAFPSACILPSHFTSHNQAIALAVSTDLLWLVNCVVGSLQDMGTVILSAK